MKTKQLQDVANILRRDSLEMTSSAGSGHPSSCLSAAEIMSVLFFNEMKYDVKNSKNSDSDEFILSKGHAAPILYSALFRAGCIDEDLNSLRKLTSNLEGHPVPDSISWAKVATGSLGQGLGVGVGMAIAGKLQKKDFRTFVLIGDSEAAEGSVFEAMALAGYYKLENLIAIIDINRLGQRGETMLGHKLAAYKKRFEGFGWNIFSVNGNNINKLKKALDKTKKSSKPTLILARTLKGKGVEFIEDQEGWHGKTLNNQELKIALKKIPEIEMPKVQISKPKKLKQKIKTTNPILERYSKDAEEATRETYGKTLSSLGKAQENILAVDAEVSNSTFSANMKSVDPSRFIETFISEQNMASVALGLSKKGFNVFASTFSAFLTRAHDQIRMASMSSGDLTFVGSHAGVSIGPDGASQMGLEDISMFRSLEGSYIFYPSEAVSAQKLTVLASKTKGIKYLRTTRSKTPVLYSSKESFKIGDFKVLKKSAKDSCVFVGSGITVFEALKASEQLKKIGKNVAVIDLYCIKPFNHKKFFDFVKKHGKKIILAEDHRPEGGIGEMIISKISKENFKMKHLAIVGIPHSGKKDELLKKYKIDSSAYVREFRRF
jgi:transketolase